MDIYEDIENELNAEKHETALAAKVKIAVSYGWRLSNFKRFISQFLLTENTEDQWSFDYECWVHHIPEDEYEHPAKWAQLYYHERWDTARMERSFESLKQIASKSKPA